jgi:hypothetical protein
MFDDLERPWWAEVIAVVVIVASAWLFLWTAGEVGWK